MTEKSYTCPVCGYTGMKGPYKGKGGFPTYEICVCCGTEFGSEDVDSTHDELRERWIRGGMVWWAKFKDPPTDWDPAHQLSLAGLTKEE